MPEKSAQKKGIPVGGLIILLLGCFFLLQDLIPGLKIPFFPVVLIIIGLAMVYKNY